MFAILLGLASAVPVAVDDGATRAAILATCHDNIDGQLQGDVVRVEGSLHPDVVMRAVATSSGHAPGALESETLLASTRRGELTLPEAKWRRSREMLSMSGNVAVVRLETPDFVSFDVPGNFDGAWRIVHSCK